MSLPTIPTRIDLLAWLTEIDQTPTATTWHIHKAQFTEALIQQHLPIQLLYHYEKLQDDIKAQYPLKGSLLKQFNMPMTREVFTSLPELSGITLNDVAKPWQLKFSGKLVIFSQNPEVAIRLWWTNTLKEFELVYNKDLSNAIEASFHHWQFVDKVEILCKTPNVILTAPTDEVPESDWWQMTPSSTFAPVPSLLGIKIQQLLNEHPFVKDHWLLQLIDLAQGQIEIQKNQPAV